MIAITRIEGRLEPHGLLILVYTMVGGIKDGDIIRNPYLMGVWDRNGDMLECIEYEIGQIGTYRRKEKA